MLDCWFAIRMKGMVGKKEKKREVFVYNFLSLRGIIVIYKLSFHNSDSACKKKNNVNTN